MLLFRSLLPAALLALASTSVLHAAQTGLLTCGGTTSIKVSYFDIYSAPNAASASEAGIIASKLTIHAALQQFGVLSSGSGSQYSGCTLTHNQLVYTFPYMYLSTVDAIAGAASTGVAGLATFTQAVFLISGVSVSGGNDGDQGGDDGGWDRGGNQVTYDTGTATAQ